MTEGASVRRQFYFLHRWVGLGFATLAVAVFSSGVLVVFGDEIDEWAHRASHTASVSDVAGFSYDNAYRSAAVDIEPGLKDRVLIRQHAGDPLQFTFQSISKSHTKKKIVEVEPTTSEVIDRYTVDAQSRAPSSRASSLVRFYLNLHLFLLMPRTLGLILTGIAGFALLLLITTGTWFNGLSLRKLRRVPTGNDRRFIGRLHAWVGAWTLPFTSILALTGTFFSFAGAILLPVIAFVSFGGDQEKLVESVIGKVEVQAESRRASLDIIMQDALKRSGGRRQIIILNEWEGDNAHAIVHMGVQHGFAEKQIKLFYNGYTGSFIEQQESLGKVPSIGGWLLELIAHLHFGTLAGVYTKILWTLFGLAASLLGVTGLLVYVRRQSEQDLPTRIMRSLAMLLSSGLPLLIVTTAIAWCLCWPLGVRHPIPILNATFAIGFILLVSAGMLMPLRSAISATSAVAGALWIILPFVAMYTQGLTWTAVVSSYTILIDMICILGGAISLFVAARIYDAPKKPLAPQESSGTSSQMEGQAT